jgi:predicted enzyme related to lactoylglutathione lyase
MTPVVTSLVPMAFVASVPRAIAFYETLGLTARNTYAPPDGEEPAWAWLESDRARLMVARATEPVVPSQQAVLFYLYCDDVNAMRATLQAAGVTTGPIQFPFYAPRGEFRVEDPDGYVLMVMQS